MSEKRDKLGEVLSKDRLNVLAAIGRCRYTLTLTRFAIFVVRFLTNQMIMTRKYRMLIVFNQTEEIPDQEKPTYAVWRIPYYGYENDTQC